MNDETPCADPWFAVDMPARLMADEYGTAGLPIRATFLYRTSDPLAIELRLFSSNDVTWLVGRSLFAAGIAGTAGEGDITMRPSADGADLFVVFQSPDGCALVKFDRGPVAAFLESTYAIVPAGDEQVDVDSFIAAMHEWQDAQ